MQEVERIKDVVADSIFPHLPDDVQNLSLLLSHQDTMLMPIAFQAWRTPISTPYSRLISDPRWLPQVDVGAIDAVAERLGFTVERRDHPVAHSIAMLRERLAALTLVAAQLEAVVDTAREGFWFMCLDTVTGQVQHIASAIETMHQCIADLEHQAAAYPLWAMTIGFSLVVTGYFLRWFVNAMVGAAPNDIDPQRLLADVDVCMLNLLYLNIDSGNVLSEQLGAVDVHEWDQAAQAVMEKLDGSVGLW